MQVGLRHSGSQTPGWLAGALRSGGTGRHAPGRGPVGRTGWRNARGKPCLSAAAKALPVLAGRLGLELPPPRAVPDPTAAPSVPDGDIPGTVARRLDGPGPVPPGPDGVADAGDRLSAAVMRTAFGSLDDGAARIGHDGEGHRRGDVPRRRVMASFGATGYGRPRHRRRGRPSPVPVDRRAGTAGSFRTPRAARTALHRLAPPPPRECVRTFRQRGGMRPGTAGPARLHGAAGRRWRETGRDAPARIRGREGVPDTAAVPGIRTCGVMAPMPAEAHADRGGGGAGWREAARATVSPGTSGGEPLRTIRHGRMPERNGRRLKKLVVEEVDAVPAKRPDIRPVTVADGAHDSRRFLEGAFPKAGRAPGFFHAARSLGKAMDQACGRDSGRGLKRWRDLRRTPRTEPGGVDRVIASLRYLARRHAPSVAGVAGCFINNRERMDHAAHGAGNLMVGSGTVEATDRVPVTQRPRGSGMTWSMSGGEAILPLRASVMPDRFDAAWKILGPYRQNHDGAENPENVPI